MFVSPLSASPQINIYFTLQTGCQNNKRHTECTISLKSGQLLLSLLSFDSSSIHVNGDPLNVCLLAESRTKRDIQAITDRHSLLSASYSSPSTACLAVSLPKWQRDWVPTFHTIDPMDDLGTSWTTVADPAVFSGMVRQFRAGS
jgi:hypothetical protein